MISTWLFSISDKSLEETVWWETNIGIAFGYINKDFNPDTFIYSDASLSGWGCKYNDKRTKGSGMVIIIIFCYKIIVNLVVFHRFQFSNDLLINKSISSIESAVQKKTAQEMTKDYNTYNSFKLENCQLSTVSGHHFLILHLF